MTQFCPSCGYNLSRDEIMEVDGFRLDPRGGVYFGEQHIPMTPQMVAVMHKVAAAKGRIVSCQAVGNAVSDGENSANVVAVQLNRIRSRLRDAEVPCPILTVHPEGYRWSVPA